MHSNWEEMLPFYIAGTLPKNETTRLVNHLSRCDDCRRSLDEWRLIADVVRADAASQMRDLPPLSGRVLRLAAQGAAGRYEQPIPFASYAPRRYNPASVTLVAALLTVILFGGLIGFMVLRGALPQPGANVVNLPSATATTTTVPSATPLPGTPSPQPQIIVIEPSATPVSPTPIPPTPSPTVLVPTRRPPTAILPPTVFIPTNPPFPSPTPEISAFSLQAPLLGNICTIQAAYPGASVNLYAEAGIDSPVIAAFGQDASLTALAQSDNGWYDAEYAPDGASAVVGWVRADQVFLSGVCDSLPLIPLAEPTPTPTDGEPATPLPLPSPTPGISSGIWSQTATVLSSTCAEPPPGGATTVSLSVSEDAITVSSADAGAFVLQRIGEQTYAGGYATSGASVSISLTFISATSYSGSAVATSAEGCITQSFLSGAYGG